MLPNDEGPVQEGGRPQAAGRKTPDLVLDVSAASEDGASPGRHAAAPCEADETYRPAGASSSSPSRLSVEEIRARLRAREAEVLELRRELDKARVRSPTGCCFGSPDLGRPLSVVIPMGELGDAFAQAGYRLPKPLVNAVGRPILLWLLDHLSLGMQDFVILALPAVVERQHGVSKLLQREFPSLNMRVVQLPFKTRGWVETMLAVTRQMSARELRQPLVTLDCSTIYHQVDLLARVRALPEGVGASAYFDVGASGALLAGGQASTQFSYLRLDGEGRILGVREKCVISSSANTGAYIFSSGRDFRVAAETLLESSEASKGGLYASNLISFMLERRAQFIGLPVEPGHFAIVSTPPQLECFVRRVVSAEVAMRRVVRFCFDLDGTLVTEPRVPGDLRTCQAIPKAIELVRQLHANGHVIVLHTSRGMASGLGVGSATAEVGDVTFATLREFDIPYHEIYFGKPHADVYVDSYSLNSQADIERDLGWFVSPPHEALEGAVDARSFNLVRASGKEHVMKSSTPDVLRGECHWYRSIPPALSRLFPVPFKIVEGDGSADGGHVSTITMGKVSGVTFSHLATARLLTCASLRRLVLELNNIHSAQPPSGSAAAAEPRATTAELCANYARKVAQRVEAHQALYDSLAEELGIDARTMSRRIIGFLEEFEAGQRAQHAHYIHGDPVFSNVLRTDEDDIVFIDMRGQLGSRITTQGDVHYDLSKVYQSLCGYDFMLLDEVLDDTTSEIFDGLRAVFWDEVRQLYPDINHRDVRLHTAAHFFAIVPLHEVRLRNVRYMRTSYSMLLVEGLL